MFAIFFWGGGRVFVLGAIFYVLENLTLQWVGVGCMGKVFVCVLVIFVRTCPSVGGVCTFIAKFV